MVNSVRLVQSGVRFESELVVEAIEWEMQKKRCGRKKKNVNFYVLIFITVVAREKGSEIM